MANRRANAKDTEPSMTKRRPIVSLPLLAEVGHLCSTQLVLGAPTPAVRSPRPALPPHQLVYTCRTLPCLPPTSSSLTTPYHNLSSLMHLQQAALPPHIHRPPRHPSSTPLNPPAVFPSLLNTSKPPCNISIPPQHLCANPTPSHNLSRHHPHQCVSKTLLLLLQ